MQSRFISWPGHESDRKRELTAHAHREAPVAALPLSIIIATLRPPPPRSTLPHTQATRTSLDTPLHDDKESDADEAAPGPRATQAQRP